MIYAGATIPRPIRSLSEVLKEIDLWRRQTEVLLRNIWTGAAQTARPRKATLTLESITKTASRFARDLIVQEVGFAMLKARGIDLIAADSPTSFLDDTPTARLIRQVLGAVSEFEKAMLVAKLRGARDRKRRMGIKVEGRKSIAEERPETVELARKLARARPKGGKRSLREISAALAETGHTTNTGRPYAPTAIKLMLARASNASRVPEGPSC